MSETIYSKKRLNEVSQTKKMPSFSPLYQTISIEGQLVVIPTPEYIKKLEGEIDALKKHVGELERRLRSNDNKQNRLIAITNRNEKERRDQ